MKFFKIDPRPSENENVKKSTPQMKIDHQEIEEVSLIEGKDKTVRIGGNLNLQQVGLNLGNTSKLIVLVNLFNIWVWFIMQVRASEFFLTCVMVMWHLVSY